MNKPKSTTIELTEGMLNAIAMVDDRGVERVAVPGKYKVYREGGRVFLEVFHND